MEGVAPLNDIHSAKILFPEQAFPTVLKTKITLFIQSLGYVKECGGD
jgi:hypothetical protein